MQAVECYKNDPEKFKSEKTTNELIKLQKLISMSKMQTDQNNFSNNNQSNQFMTSNFIPKEVAKIVGKMTQENPLFLKGSLHNHKSRTSLTSIGVPKTHRSYGAWVCYG